MSEEPLKVLLAEDEEAFRDILNTLLTKAGYKVTVAQDGQIAKNIFSLHPFDLVISDIKMPNMDGIELLQWIKSEKDIPVILMTGFSEVLETKKAYDLGADAFLPKPFKQEDLIAAIETGLKKSTSEEGKDDSEEKEEEPEEYCKLGIGDFIAGKEIPHDIYVKLSEDKYVKIAYEGEDIPFERIQSYKDKGMTHLYMLKRDFQAYLSMNLKLAKALSQTKKIPKKKKLKFLKQASDVMQEQLFVVGVDQEAFSDSKEFVNSTLSIVADDGDVLSLLDLLKDHANFLYAHSLGVSLYSVMLAKKARWHSIPNRFRIALAGMFHDIGKKEIDRSILEKKRIHLSQEERALIETHPARGQEIVSQMKSLPPDLAQIIYQHHEDCNGYGYPGKLTRTKIHPMARMIAVADTFCNFVIPGPQSDGMSAIDAISQILQFHGDRLDKEFVGLLMQAFKYDRHARKKAAA